MIGGSKGWWIDIEAKRHVCHDHRLFKTYNGITNTNIFLGDHHSTKVSGVEYVELRFTSGKILTLKEVLHTPEIRENMVSGYLLNKVSFAQTIGADFFT